MYRPFCINLFSANNNAKKLKDIQLDYEKHKSYENFEDSPYTDIPVEIRKELWYVLIKS